jgi:hypothetical protein
MELKSLRSNDVMNLRYVDKEGEMGSEREF